MSRLSEERRRQIREEEQAKFQLALEEERFREQVRRELSASTGVASEAPNSIASRPTPGFDLPSVPAPYPPSRARRAPRRRRWPIAFIVAGFGLVAYAWYGGFRPALPWARSEVTVEGTASGTPIRMSGTRTATLPQAEKLFAALDALKAGAKSSSKKRNADSPGKRAAEVPSPKPSTKPSSGKLVTFHGITLRVPNGWRITQSDELVEAKLIVRDSVVAWVALLLDETPGMSLDSVAAELASEFVGEAGSVSGARLIGQRTVRVDGVSAIRFDSVQNGPDGEERSWSVVFLRGDSAFLLQMSSSRGQFGRYSSTFESILKSLRIATGGPS